MANPNIFSQYLQPARSMSDYAADMDSADMRRMQMAGIARQNQLADMAAQDAAEQKNALRALLADPDAADPIKREQIAARDPRLLAQSQAWAKARQEAEHLAAQTANQRAQAAKNEAAAKDDAIKRQRDAIQLGLNELASMRGPADAMRVLRVHAQQGMPQEQVAQMSRELMSISTPEQWQAWQQQTNGRLMSAAQRIEAEDRSRQAARQAQVDAVAAANRPILLGKDGEMRPNVPLQQFEKQKARAGASNTTINTGQKGLDNELKVRGDFRAEPVYKAHQEMQSAYSQIQQSLKQASPAGDLAAATKMMKLLDPGSVVRESELGMAMAATGLLDRIQSFVPNIINGTKLSTDQRRQFQALADALFNESVSQYNGKRKEYSELGGGYGMNVNRLLGPAATPPTMTSTKKKGAADAPAFDYSAADKIISGGK